MTPRRFVCFAAGFVIALNLFGCAASGTYPANWPETVRGELVGKCPSIAGKYGNRGVHDPADSPSHSLTELLGLEDGDYVVIVQSPKAISVSAWKLEGHVETASFTSGEVSWGWDASRPRSFICPMDILSGRVLSFPHLAKGYTRFTGGAGAVGFFEINFSSVSKTADGALVIMLQSGGGAVVGPVPVGRFERVWYKFERLD